jgi:integrase
MRDKLIKSYIDEREPAAKSYTVWDSELSGFGLRIEPSGKKVYVLKYRVGGKQGWYTIGRHGSPWTPDKARKEAKRLLGDVAHGIDPAEKRRADSAAISFAELCDLYLAEGVAHKKASTLRVDRGRIELHLKPLIGRKRADAITRADIERLQGDVRNGRTATAPETRKAGSVVKGGAGVAAQCVALASTVLQFAVDRKIRADNPARGVKKPPVRKMQRFLSEAEFARLADALNDEERASGNPFTVAAIQILALTGCRRGEIETLRWRNVDFARGFLLLDDSKTREKVVYLSPPAVSILSELPRLECNPFVFAGGQPGKPTGALVKVWERVRERAGLADVRMHDLRHSYASVGAGASLGLPIIGKLLGHTQASTTQRYAHLSDDPLRRASDTIGATIAAAMGRAPDNVARLHKRAP